MGVVCPLVLPNLYLSFYGFLQATAYPGIGAGIILLPVFAIITLLALFLPIRKFFPRKSPMNR